MTDKLQQQPASDYIKIYSKHDGVPGNPIENWYAENKSNNSAIKFTILFWRGNITFGDKWTKTFEIEPGEIKGIGNKRSSGSTTINAQLRGARYTC